MRRRVLFVKIVLWCNGSTAVFGSACLGSNPGKTTEKSDYLCSRFFRAYTSRKKGVEYVKIC